MTAPSDGSHVPRAGSPPIPLPRGLVVAYGTGQAAEGIASYLLTTLLLFYYTSLRHYDLSRERHESIRAALDARAEVEV
jgi:Na+/melibiose symporter-like transporter